MDITDDIKNIREKILSADNADQKKELVDRLIELEGLKTMHFFQSIFLIDPFSKEPTSEELKNIAGYAVRKLIELRAIESKKDFKFCPYCKSGLEEYKIIDPYLIGLKCVNNHHFHIEVNQRGQCTDNSLRANSDNPISIATEWLTNLNLRKELFNQSAEILRKYIELNYVTNNSEEKNEVYRFCPICGEPLNKFDQNDVWVEGLECVNNHRLLSRNGLSYKGATFAPDMSKEVFEFHVKGYLEDGTYIHLPDQVMQLLNTIRSTFKD